MENTMTGMDYKIREVAGRIRELREISGLTVAEMAKHTGVSEEEYIQIEAGNRNLSIAFLYRCALIFGVDFSDTGGAAVVDDAFEAVFPGLFIGFGVAAGAQTESCQKIFQRHFKRTSLRKWSEILKVAGFFDPGKGERRKLFVPVDFQEQIAFVVAHEDVVMRRIGFDEF